MNHSDVETESVKVLPLYCSKIVLDSDVSKALNAEAFKNIQDQVPEQLWESIKKNMSPAEAAPEHVVEYVKKYLSTGKDSRFFVFKDEGISLHWEESESRWYIRIFHWEMPRPIFDAEFQKLVKLAKQSKAKIPIPEPDEDEFTSVEDKKIEIINDLISRHSIFSPIEDTIIGEGDQVILRIDEQDGNPYEKTFFIDSSFVESYQLYNSLIGCSKGDKKRIGIVTQNYEPKIIEFEVLEVKSIIEEIEDLDEVSEDLVKALGFEGEKAFDKHIEQVATTGLNEDRLMALINGLDIVFDHYCVLPDLPLQLVMDMLEKYPYLSNLEGVKSYFINKGFAEAFLGFEEEDPSIVNMFVKSWALKRITFKSTRDPSLWNLIDE